MEFQSSARNKRARSPMNLGHSNILRKIKLRMGRRRVTAPERPPS